MSSKNKFAAYAAVSLMTACLCTKPSSGQGFQQQSNSRASDPNMGHFFMGRQEITIEDNSPKVINHSNSNIPQGASPSGLPAAGFQQWASSVHTYSNLLPKVNNGVPVKPIPEPPVKQAEKKRPIKPKLPPGTERYTPYKGYAPGTSTAAATGHTADSSTTNVKGSVLHWARGGSSSMPTAPIHTSGSSSTVDPLSPHKGKLK